MTEVQGALPKSSQMGVMPEMDVRLDEYYAAAGWERESGRPTAATLERLGLEFGGQLLAK